MLSVPGMIGKETVYMPYHRAIKMDCINSPVITLMYHLGFQIPPVTAFDNINGEIYAYSVKNQNKLYPLTLRLGDIGSPPLYG
jgi:hypothetical protein